MGSCKASNAGTRHIINRCTIAYVSNSPPWGTRNRSHEGEIPFLETLPLNGCRCRSSEAFDRRITLDVLDTYHLILQR